MCWTCPSHNGSSNGRSRESRTHRGGSQNSLFFPLKTESKEPWDRFFLYARVVCQVRGVYNEETDSENLRVVILARIAYGSLCTKMLGLSGDAQVRASGWGVKRGSQISARGPNFLRGDAHNSLAFGNYLGFPAFTMKFCENIGEK